MPTRDLARHVRKEAKRESKRFVRNVRRHGVGDGFDEGFADVRTASDAFARGLASDTEPSLDAVKDWLAEAQFHEQERYFTARKSMMWEVLETILLALFGAMWLRGCLVGAFTIPSTSMLPTLRVGDFLFVNKAAYSVKFPYTNWELWHVGEPEAGEVIVFDNPCDNRAFVKRIVAVAGDTVEVRCEQLYVNGKLVPRELIDGEAQCPDPKHPGGVRPCRLFRESNGAYSYTTAEIKDESDKRPDFPTPNRSEFQAYPGDARLDLQLGKQGCQGGKRNDWQAIRGRTRVHAAQQMGTCSPFAHYTIPPGYVFVFGDNRRNSRDSQYTGPVPVSAITGRASFIWASKPADAQIWEVWKFHAARIGKFVHESSH